MPFEEWRVTLSQMTQSDSGNWWIKTRSHFYFQWCSSTVMDYSSWVTNLFMTLTNFSISILTLKKKLFKDSYMKISLLLCSKQYNLLNGHIIYGCSFLSILIWIQRIITTIMDNPQNWVLTSFRNNIIMNSLFTFTFGFTYILNTHN